MPDCRHCGNGYSPRQTYKIPGAQVPPEGCSTCVRLCRCGAWYILTPAERTAQDMAVKKHAARMKRGKLGAIPDTLPRLCEECRPAPKVAKSAKGGNVLAIGGRR